MKNPPLLELFLLLRDEAGFPLTIDQYHMLIQALKGGFGISSREDLKRICRLLWVQPNYSQLEKFNSCFDLYFEKLQPVYIDQKKSRKYSSKRQNNPDIKLEDSNSKVSEDDANISLQESSPTPIAFKGKLLPEERFQDKKYQLTIRDFPFTERKIQ